MFVTRRLLSRSSGSIYRAGTAEYSRTVVGCQESYTERQAKKNRPVSPHVTIYRFPAVALSSITNRVTGVMLAGALFFTVIVVLV